MKDCLGMILKHSHVDEPAIGFTIQGYRGAEIRVPGLFRLGILVLRIKVQGLRLSVLFKGFRLKDVNEIAKGWSHALEFDVGA